MRSTHTFYILVHLMSLLVSMVNLFTDPKIQIVSD